jgi:hypothetical protein
MRALVFGAASLSSVFCLSSLAIAQSRNQLDIYVHNKANHPIELHNVTASPQAKDWSFNPQTVKALTGVGLFRGHWDDNQGQWVTVEFQGMTPGPYGCLVSCSVQVQVPLYKATEGTAGLQCSSETPKVTYQTTSNNNVCGNVSCSTSENGWIKNDPDTCSYTLHMDFTDPDHF